ncbi:epimerase [uncultured Friedmanniella sp.]|uniref:epimerase n=1 Tax=uncultured Friedmanniella sp. TaxID=335381 RepID=UPI0035CC0E4D
MTSPRAVVAGASGFLGPPLIADLTSRGYEVAVLGRRGPDARWTQPERVRALVDGADLLVNLAGRSVGCRYTDRNRDEIYASRVDTTQALHGAVAAAADPPRLWLNASTATIYRHATDRPQTEEDGELGSGFSVDVARAWEHAFISGGLPRTRRVAMRMAIVLGNGPALQMLARAARFGLGGAQLDGRWFPHRRYRGIGPDATPAAPPHGATHGEQKFSWIHVDDLVAAVAFLDEHDELSGPVNLAAPGTSTNVELMRELRRAVHAPFGLPAPRWLLEPGMLVLRQESELVLKSRWAVPEKLLDAGFTFRWPELPAAVADLVGR